MLLPLGYALLVTVYVELRYGFRWAEQDTGQIAGSIRATLAQGSISPTGSYPFGYGYQAISAMLGLVTGINVTSLQLTVMPFLSLVVALAAFVAFRALTGDARIAGVAAVLLMIQPELQFVIQRGSHEKVTHAFVLLLIFVLTIGLLGRLTLPATVALTLAFYLLAWSLIATNSFFASSYIACLVLAILGGVVVLWRMGASSAEQGVTRRLMYAVSSCFALLFAFIAYIYRPAGYTLSILGNVLTRLAVLLFSFEPQSNPYATLTVGPGAAWAAPWVYPILTAFNAFIVFTAAATWIWLTLRLWHRRDMVLMKQLLLLWLLAPAFAVEVLGSVSFDLSGNLAGSNLEVRLFPLFMLAAIPLSVVGLSRMGYVTRAVPQTIVVLVGVVVVAGFAATGILKATNDPLVSNKWLFYTPAELACVGWTDAGLQRQTIWVGFDERLEEMQILRAPPDPSRGNQFVVASEKGARYLVMSTVIRERAPRLGVPAPITQADDIVYDDGGAQLYHLVPETPYQP